MADLPLFIFVFVLASFVGFEIITKVPPTLHTPLMSGSQRDLRRHDRRGAVGGGVASDNSTLGKWLGFVAVSSLARSTSSVASW